MEISFVGYSTITDTDSSMNYVGIDIGGTNIKAGLVDDSGAVREVRRIPSIIDNIDGLLKSLTTLIADFQSQAIIEAVGIGIPGLRSTKTHLIETSPNIPCIHNLNLEDLLSKQLKMPVISENDANAGAYGEWVTGAGRGLQFMAYLTIGTGLGCGLVLSGSLYRGASGYAGEIGHVNVEPFGRPCACGSTGCFETRVSAPGLILTARELGMKESSAEAIYNAAIDGNTAALATFEVTGRFLGIACANLINLLNLESIVIGGGVMASSDLLLRSASDEVRLRAFEPAARICPIVQSQLRTDAGFIGAAMLARDRQ
jgi:glucokinase